MCTIINNYKYIINIKYLNNIINIGAENYSRAGRRDRWHVGHINMLKERKSGVLKWHIPFQHFLLEFLLDNHILTLLDFGLWHMLTSAEQLEWSCLNYFWSIFPESKTKVDPNETAFRAIKNAFEDKDNQIHFVLHNKMNQSMPVFDLRVSSWHLAQRAGTQIPFFSLPWRSTKWSWYIICAPQ